MLALLCFLWGILALFLWKIKRKALLLHSVLCFLIMCYAEQQQFGELPLNSLLSYSSLCFFMTGFFLLLNNRTGFLAKLIYSLCYLLLLSLPVSFLIYQLQFEHAISIETLYALFQTNRSESIEYVHDFISARYLAVGALTLLLPLFISFLDKKKASATYVSWTLMASAVLYLSFSPAAGIPNFVITAAQNYRTELQLFQETASKMSISGKEIEAHKDGRGETHIVVIGESLHKGHMSLYGYPRQTTPMLDSLQEAEGFILFDKAYANHTHTIEVLKYSLTEANQYNGQNFYESVSILDLLKAADTETYWISNQNMKGAWDNVVAILAHRAEHLVSLNASIGTTSKMQFFDGRCIEEVQKVLEEESEKSRVLFVHLMGSHSSYDSRYPKKEFSAFQGLAFQGDVGSQAAQIKNLYAYDNSIYYNDYVVGKLLKLLMEKEGANSFIYLADHADDVLQQKGHNSGAFTYEMAEAPMMSWMSSDYREKYKARYEQLLANSQQWYSNDLLFNTLLGIYQIETPLYDSLYDYSSSAYHLPDSQLTVLHKKAYTAEDNYRYWQRENMDFLLANKLQERVYPHRVNSLGKLEEVWRLGGRSFELDVRFGDDSSNTFTVGHHLGRMGHSLESFLERIPYQEIQRLWLDFKNLEEQQYKAALAELERLNDRFQLKGKVLLETGSTAAFVQSFSRAGWKTSYYLPSTTILNALEENEQKLLQQLASTISQQCRTQELKAISFDNRLYPFVKKQLEPLLAPSIDYHCWYGPKLNSPAFQEELNTNPLFLDSRVKSILCPFHSLFYL
jgi:heptose-I-phosphate ethanolaminephosphotransferase